MSKEGLIGSLNEPALPELELEGDMVMNALRTGAEKRGRTSRAEVRPRGTKKEWT